jgi:hypothetical protein
MRLPNIQARHPLFVPYRANAGYRTGIRQIAPYRYRLAATVHASLRWVIDVPKM